jgi:hypothetical protein
MQLEGLGRGSVALEAIGRGEVVVAFGGRILTRDEFDLLPATQQARSIQVEDSLYMAGAPEPEPADFVNHSCEPNCCLSGSVVLIAGRDIAPGEQLTYDYATAMGSDVDEFECACGSAGCRSKITGRDWMLPELQLKYRGTFSPYLARRIAALAGAGATRRTFAL